MIDPGFSKRFRKMDREHDWVAGRIRQHQRLYPHWFAMFAALNVAFLAFLVCNGYKILVHFGIL